MGCTICLAHFGADAGPEHALAPAALGCGHIFHLACIEQWFGTLHPPSIPHCPQCKTPSPGRPLRLFPAAADDLDVCIRALPAPLSLPSPPAAAVERVAAARLRHAAPPDMSSPDRGGVVFARLEPPPHPPDAWQEELGGVACEARSRVRPRSMAVLESDDDDGHEEQEEQGLEQMTWDDGSAIFDSPSVGRRANRRRGRPAPPSEPQCALQDRLQAERQRATLRGRWPEAATNALLEHLVQFHLALQEYVVSAHGLRLFSLPYAGRKLCAFLPILAPRPQQDTATLQVSLFLSLLCLFCLLTPQIPSTSVIASSPRAVIHTTPGMIALSAANNQNRFVVRMRLIGSNRHSAKLRKFEKNCLQPYP